MVSLELLGIIASVIGFIGYAPYLWNTYKGNVHPHIFSFFIFGLLTAIGYVAQVADGGGPGAWVTGFSALVCFGIAALSAFKGGSKYITKSDWFAFSGALLAVPAWIITKDPLLSVIIVTITDALGFYPTFRKGWHNPHDDMIIVFFLSGLKFIFGVWALENFTLVTALYPISLIIMNWLFVTMIVYRRAVLKQ